ncbi:MAG TPA: molybdate ABC transporter substrate-binding protein [Bacillota bacterium]|nr:molybdate ABC transporter substrate-binding protein [Bacillota bacterium]
MKQTAALMIILVIMAGCSYQETKEKDELFISAAASLTEAMDELVHAFTKEYPDVDVTTNFGSSGQLSRQIQQGAPVDIFLSADQTWMDTLEDQGRIFSKTRIDFAANQLVMIAKKENTATSDNLDALAQNSRDQIAIGNPDNVPAGRYTKEALMHEDLWDLLEDQFVFAKDVSQVLAYVESGNTEIGFVYKTDADRSDHVQVITTIDASLHEPIVYPAAVVKTSINRKTAEAFLSFLESDRAQTILNQHGFLSVNE